MEEIVTAKPVALPPPVFEPPVNPRLVKTTPVKAKRRRSCEAVTLIRCGRPAVVHHFDGRKGVYLCDHCRGAAGVPA